jgi:hypothetical protein
MSEDLESLVAAYINIRDERQKLKQEYDDKDKLLKNDLEKLEQALLASCNSINANSIRTNSGTIIRSTKERFFCTDWYNFQKFVLENKAVDLFEKRINQGSFKMFMENYAGDGLPPGVNVMREFAIVVRKS